MIFINVKYDGVVETVDENKSYREAVRICKEYNMGDSFNQYYTSQRSTKDWRTK